MDLQLKVCPHCQKLVTRKDTLVRHVKQKRCTVRSREVEAQARHSEPPELAAPAVPAPAAVGDVQADRRGA
eukprot:2293580-Pyramimonas_sp.AAC.1